MHCARNKREAWAYRLVWVGVFAYCLLGAVCFAAESGSGKGVPPPGFISLHIQQIVLVNGEPAVLLVDEPEQRYLLMFIDFFMAQAIRMGMAGPQLERPLTHDLIGIFLRRLGARVAQVAITELRDNTYYALISVEVNGETTEFDARPSDALAIAVRSRTPMYAAEALLKPIDQLHSPPPDDTDGPGEGEHGKT